MNALQHRFTGAPPPPPQLPSMSDPLHLPLAPPPQLPSMSDPLHLPLAPPPPQPNWYPNNQFQFHASHPPPPPPQQQQQQQPIWTNNNNNHSDHLQLSSSYPTPNQNTHVPPYPTHLPPPQQQNSYYPPPPPPPPSYSQPPQAYPPQSNTHQTWGNPNWTHHQVWEHPDRKNPNNDEDLWAAKARAWAAAKSAMENQHQPSHFTHDKPEEHSHGFQDQYQQTVDHHYGNFQQTSLPAPSHQQFSASIGDPNRKPANHLPESSFFSSVPSSHYASDLHSSYANRDGAVRADPYPLYPQHGNILTNSSGYQQEVPSSYSSVPGKCEDVRSHTPLFPMSSDQETQHHMLPTLTAPGRSVSEEQPYFTYGAGSSGPVTDPSDRPLEFAPGFTRNHESHDQPQSSYMHPDPPGPMGYTDHATSASSVSALASPVVPGMGYPPSGIQFDPSFVPPASVYGQISGPSFHPSIPNGGAAFGLSAGSLIHPTSAFIGDLSGVAAVSDRPKKAPVPNWLREEIIKKKAVISSSSQERPEEDPDSPIENDNIEKSFLKRSSTDSKSIDSSRSSDNEDGDEDDTEAARTAAINQEIKRILTEVLLKVTDELFDEIATRVLNEDDLAVEGDHRNSVQNQKLSPSPPSVPAAKASAKILLPDKIQKTKSDDASGKSPASAGDVLGLGSYASDEDDYDAESSGKSTRIRMDAAAPLQSIMLSEGIPIIVENGGSNGETKGLSGMNMDIPQDKVGLIEAFSTPLTAEKELRGSNELENLTQVSSVIAHGDNMVETADDLKLKNTVGGKNSLKANVPRVDADPKSLTDTSQASQARSKSEKNHELESRKSYSSKDVKEAGASSLKVTSKQSGSGEPRRDEKHARKEKTDDRNGVKERVKDRCTKSGDKVRESDSRKSSHSKDDKTENEKVKKNSAKDDSGRKRVREKDDKEDRSRHHSGRDSSNLKRRNSPSVGSRVRNSMDNSFGSHNESSDEASDDSRRRKKYSRKRSLSPSPTRSRRRQLSRSPHSKRSHRRQSPYSSLENRRGRRSRSNSPARRRR